MSSAGAGIGAAASNIGSNRGGNAARSATRGVGMRSMSLSTSAIGEAADLSGLIDFRDVVAEMG